MVASLLALARPHSCAAGMVLTAVGHKLAAGDLLWNVDIAAAAVAIALLIAGANGFNDVCDRVADAVSAPHRPIPAGMIDTRTALVHSFLCLAAAVVCAALVQWRLGMFALVLALMSALYSTHVKSVPLVGNAWVAATSASAVLFGALSSGSLRTTVLIPFVATLLYMTAFEILKTIRDQHADRSVGISTISSVFGARRTARLGVLVLAGAIVWIFATGGSVTASPTYFILASCGTVMLLLAVPDVLRDVEAGSSMRRILRILRVAQIPLLSAMFLL